jgi:predicted GTPase
MGNVVIAAITVLPAVITAVINAFKELKTPPTQPTPMPPSPDKSADQLRIEAQKELGINTNAINFAFVGGTGAGKSTMINAVRGITNRNDSNAAPTGSVETTQEITPYQDPTYPHIFYWDLPGSGTIRHTAASYCQEKKLHAFDHLLIIGSTRFLQFDIDVAKFADTLNIPVTFVRMKMDQEIDNEIDGQSNYNLDQIKKKLRTEIQASMKADLLQQGIKNPEIFLINKRSFNPNDKDAEKYAIDEVDLVTRIVNVTIKRRY